jgi:hypothetical protein
MVRNLLGPLDGVDLRRFGIHFPLPHSLSSFVFGDCLFYFRYIIREQEKEFGCIYRTNSSYLFP